MCLGYDLNRELLGSRFKSSARSFFTFCDVFPVDTSHFLYPFNFLKDMSREPLGFQHPAF
jgi:hypothetical protein